VRRKAVDDAANVVAYFMSLIVNFGM